MPIQHELSLDQAAQPRFSPGVYVSKSKLILGAVLFVVLLVVVGVIAGKAGRTECHHDHHHHEDHSSNGSSDGSSGGTTDTDNSTDSKIVKRATNVRLPKHLQPVSYSVKLLPFITEHNFTFNGEVKIIMNATASANNITVHIKDLKIDESRVVVTTLTDKKQVPIKSFKYDLEREFFIVQLRSNISAGQQYVLSVAFVGNLNDGLAGLYRSSYQNKAGKTVWLAVTQFEATDARRAFPCFDEPQLKAVFNITLGRSKTMHSASNMPIAKTMPVDGMPDYEWDIYQPSVPMSTYLVAFLVSNFEKVKPTTNDSSTEFSIYVRKEAIDQTEYALRIGPKILSHFEDYFEIKYPLPKQDMVALPDFSAGAMENWGLITYRETALLYKPGTSSEANKKRVAIVVAHELAHQWFGNLVTPYWWTDLWLNEGFASYVEYLGVDHVEPEWKMLEQFVIDDLQNVMKLDALENSHPVSMEVNHPEEIIEIFDAISYKKGASIIRMIEHFLSTATMRKGLTNYLNKFKYKAASQDNLWLALTEQAHRDGTISSKLTVKTVMDTWTLQSGYPVLTVSRDYNKDLVNVNQKRFLLHNVQHSENITRGDESNTTSLWWIPLTYTEKKTHNFDNTSVKQWMGEKEMQLSKLADRNSWLLFNIQETGYYKVNYDKKNWIMLNEQLKTDHKKIHTLNRAQLLDDSMDLARAGLVSYEIVLDMLKYLKKETEYVPWAAALNNLRYIFTQLETTAAFGKLEKFLLSTIEPQYAALGFEDQSNDTQPNILLRSHILQLACLLEHKDCVKNSQQLYSDYMANPENNTIPPNKRYMVYCVALRNGDASHWDFGWQRLQETNSATEKNTWYWALGCTRKVWLLQQYLNKILPEKHHKSWKREVRVQDITTVYAAVAENIVGHYLAQNFFNAHWEELLKVFRGTSFQMERIIGAYGGRVRSMNQLVNLIAFRQLHRHKLGQAQRTLDQVIENGIIDRLWMRQYYSTIEQWFD